MRLTELPTKIAPVPGAGGNPGGPCFWPNEPGPRVQLCTTKGVAP